MYFSKVTIPTSADYFSFLRESDFGNIYHAHQLLWKLFPNNPDAKRDFIFREQQEYNRVQYYLVSERKPELFFGLDIQTKEYAPKLKADDLYSFNLRANPVITRKSNGRKNSIQHDILMDAKKEARENKFSVEDEYSHIRDKTIQWLEAKAKKSGISVEPSKVDFEGYKQHTLYKKNAQPIQFSTVNYFGVLRVEDADDFQKSLFYGIGKKKAFGCGLLLIKPV